MAAEHRQRRSASLQRLPGKLDGRRQPGEDRRDDCAELRLHATSLRNQLLACAAGARRGRKQVKPQRGHLVPRHHAPMQRIASTAAHRHPTSSASTSSSPTAAAPFRRSDHPARAIVECGLPGGIMWGGTEPRGRNASRTGDCRGCRAKRLFSAGHLPARRGRVSHRQRVGCPRKQRW